MIDLSSGYQYYPIFNMFLYLMDAIHTDLKWSNLNKCYFLAPAGFSP